MALNILIFKATRLWHSCNHGNVDEH